MANLLPEMKNSDPEVQEKYESAMNNQEFQKYLKKTKALPALNKALKDLYEENPRPRLGTQYICTKLEVLGDVEPHPMQELEQALAKIESLLRENQELRHKNLAEFRANPFIPRLKKSSRND